MVRLAAVVVSLALGCGVVLGAPRPARATLGAPAITQPGEKTLLLTFAGTSGATGYRAIVDGRPRRTEAGPESGSVELTVSDVKPGVHTVAVQAMTDAGAGDRSPNVRVTVLPALKSARAPSKAAGTRQTGAGAVDVVTKKTPSASAHRLVIDGVVDEAVGTVGADRVTWSLTGLAAGPHTFAVVASNAISSSPNSAPYVVAVLPAPGPAGPLRVKQASDTSMSITFESGAHATTHVIAVDGVVVAEKKAAQGNLVNTNTVAVKGLAPLSAHTVSVVARNVVADASSVTGGITFHPKLNRTVGVPVVTQLSATSVRITIEPTPNATSYEATIGGGPVATFDSATGVTMTVDGLRAGRTYSFAVQAANPRMRAPASSEATIKLVPALEAAPEVVFTDETGGADGTLDVSAVVTRVKPADGYRLSVDDVVISSHTASSLTYVGGATTLSTTVADTATEVCIVAYNLLGPSPETCHTL